MPESPGSQPAAAGSPAKAAPEVDKFSPEYKKKRFNATLVAFNFTFMGFGILYTQNPWFPDWSWSVLLLGGFTLAGGVAYYTWNKMS